MHRPIILHALLAMTFAWSANGFAVDDIVVDPAVVKAPLVALTPETIDRWIYGMDADRARRAIESKVNQKIRELDKKYDLTEAMRHKLELAARADKIRLYAEIDALKSKCPASIEDRDQLNTIRIEANDLRKKQLLFLGPDSFFAKAANTILVDAPRSTNSVVQQKQVLSRHQANIEAAVRIVERKVNLRDPQRKALIKLLSQETQPSQVIGNFDDLVVQYELCRLPEAKLRPLFDEDQWPNVLLAIESVKGLKPLLTQKGLIDQRRGMISNVALPVTRLGGRNFTPVPVPLPDERGED